MERLCTALINKPPLVFGMAGVLLAAGILCSAVQPRMILSQDTLDTVLSGHVTFGLLISLLVLLAAIGWRIDNQPGRSTALALSVLPAASLVYMLLPLAQRGEWLPIWNVLMTGLAVVSGYIGWRIRARFAVIAVAGAGYTMLVTAGIAGAMVSEFSTPLALGVLSTGGLTVCLISAFGFFIQERVRASRRDSMRQHILSGAVPSCRLVLRWGGSALLIALSVAALGAGPVRALGLLTAVGAVIGVFTAVACPSLYQLAAEDTDAAPAPDKPSRRESRRR
jgi:hypothetical protein